MTVCNSTATVYKTPDFMSEQTDQLLYGESAEIIDEQGAFYKVISEYGYAGWVVKQNLFGEFFECNYFVDSIFADLLFEAKPKLPPYMNLPYGAKIRAELSEKLPRYAFVTHPNEHSFYIHKNHISPINNAPKSVSRIREDICNTAKKYLGVQYRWGGRTHLGIDCSGLCFNAYKFNGISIWRDADIQKNNNLYEIPFNTAQKGDLLFFKGHVALYLGEDKIIHATVKNGGVAIENLKGSPYMKDFICAATAFK